MNKLTIGLLIVVIGSGAFYGGMKYGQNAGVASGQNGANDSGRPRGGRNAGGGGFVNGEVIAKDATSITVKTRDGSSKIVFVGEKTPVIKSVDGVADDVAVGKNVMINGATNADGSIAAQSVQIRPATNDASQK